MSTVSLADQVMAVRGQLALAEIDLRGLVAVGAPDWSPTVRAVLAERDALAAACATLERLSLLESVGANLNAMEVEVE